MKPIQDPTMIPDNTLNWLLANIATLSVLFMSQEVMTFIGHIVSWVGILALATYNAIKAYVAWRSLKKKGDSDAA